MSKLRIRHGDSEIEIDGADQFINEKLQEFYEKVIKTTTHLVPTSLKKEILELGSKIEKGGTPTPAEFYKSKGKIDGISQILIFGKYLETYKGLSEFTRKEINQVTKEARLSKDIHSQYFANATKQGLLRNLGQSKYSLTLSAESVISAM